MDSARAFVHRLTDLSASVKQLDYIVHLNVDARSEIEWCTSCLLHVKLKTSDTMAALLVVYYVKSAVSVLIPELIITHLLPNLLPNDRSTFTLDGQREEVTGQMHGTCNKAYHVHLHNTCCYTS